jgi:AbiV family abortive infection protein
VKKKLDQYRGPLTDTEIAEGMNAAGRNARRLAADAAVMIREESFPTAAALAILSIEESGKTAILRGMAALTSEGDIKQAWQQYRKHTAKNVMWQIGDLVARGARRLDDFRPLFAATSDSPYVLEMLKQIALYTDCLGQRHWSEPPNAVESNLAQSLVQTADLLAQRKPVEVAEVTAWRKHMQPVWGTSTAAMSAAIIRWHDEMVEAGLADDSHKGELEQFIQEGIPIPKPS